MLRTLHFLLLHQEEVRIRVHQLASLVLQTNQSGMAESRQVGFLNLALTPFDVFTWCQLKCFRTSGLISAPPERFFTSVHRSV